MNTRIEAKQLIALLTTDECRGLLADSLPILDKDATKSYRAVYQALADAGINEENKQRAAIFREELKLYLDKKAFILEAKKLIADGSEKSQQMIAALFAEGDNAGASETAKMRAEVLHDELRPIPDLNDDVLGVIGGCLTPSQTALRALDMPAALKLIKQEASQSESDKQLAAKAKETILAQNQFARCSRRFYNTINSISERLIQLLLHHVKKGASAKVIEMITSHPELLEKSGTIDGYSGMRFYPIQLAAAEKNGLMCKAIKEVAIAKLKNGLVIMQDQLKDDFFLLRLQPEIPYDFDPLKTAFATNTNVEAAMTQYLSDLEKTTKERGFPLSVFSQIMDIYQTTTQWLPAQHDELFIKAFGGAHAISPDWLKLVFAQWSGKFSPLLITSFLRTNAAELGGFMLREQCATQEEFISLPRPTS